MRSRVPCPARFVRVAMLIGGRTAIEVLSELMTCGPSSVR